jgi:hypothetical protein
MHRTWWRTAEGDRPADPSCTASNRIHSRRLGSRCARTQMRSDLGTHSSSSARTPTASNLSTLARNLMCAGLGTLAPPGQASVHSPNATPMHRGQLCTDLRIRSAPRHQPVPHTDIWHALAPTARTPPCTTPEGCARRLGQIATIVGAGSAGTRVLHRITKGGFHSAVGNYQAVPGEYPQVSRLIAGSPGRRAARSVATVHSAVHR